MLFRSGYKDLKKTGKGKVSTNSESDSGVLGKCVSRKDNSNSDDNSEELGSGPGPSKKLHTSIDVEVIDLTMMSSSPVPEPINTPSASPNVRPRASSPISYGSDDENQVRIALQVIRDYAYILIK